MTKTPDLIDFERQGWNALSSGPNQAKEFYGSVLADEAQMLFSGEMRLFGKRQILEMMGGPPWQSFEISEAQQVVLSSTAQVVTYKVVAQREGAEPYRALISSAYALRGEVWQLVLHQQTPA